MLAYHSATIYKKELFVFGGVHPSCCPGVKACSNALYIFNPEFELWYQPIVEGSGSMFLDYISVEALCYYNTLLNVFNRYRTTVFI